MAKLTIAQLTAQLNAVTAERDAALDELKALRTPTLSECPEYLQVDTPDVVLTPMDSELAEYAALHCAIGYIKTAPKTTVTYYTDRSGQRWCKTRTGNRAVSVMCQ